MMTLIKNKAFLICLLGLVFFKGASGQSLSFSDVILLGRGVTDTVPAGKVWKLESYTTKQEVCGGWSSAPIGIQINGVVQYLAFSLRDGNGVTFNSNSELPMWFPAGTILMPVNAGGCLQTLSIIEFNVVP